MVVSLQSIYIAFASPIPAHPSWKAPICWVFKDFEHWVVFSCGRGGWHILIQRRPKTSPEGFSPHAKDVSLLLPTGFGNSFVRHRGVRQLATTPELYLTGCKTSNWLAVNMIDPITCQGFFFLKGSSPLNAFSLGSFVNISMNDFNMTEAQPKTLACSSTKNVWLLITPRISTYLPWHTTLASPRALSLSQTLGGPRPFPRIITI